MLVSSNLPVMIWIHGGGFMGGDSMGGNVLDNYLYDGQEIADRGNIVFVSVAYRVGVLGFLSTGDSNLPGEKSFNCKTLYILLCNLETLQCLRVDWFLWSCGRKLRSVGPACRHRLGAQKHPLICWRPTKHHCFWRVCRWSKCWLPGKS